MELDDGHDGEHGDEHGGEPGDEHGDEDLDRPLLHPDDRLWRHPSEIAAHGLPGWGFGGRARVSEGPQHGRIWPSAFLSGSIGALLVIGMVTAVGGFRTRQVRVPSVVRVAVGPIEATAPNARLADPTVIVTDRVHSAMVQVKAERPEGVLFGSGFLFTTDGFIFTAQRVIEGATKAWVTLANAAVREAVIVGTDPDTGIAVLKIDGANLTSAVIGTATRLKPGQTAIAVGSPTWIGVGAVSAVGKAVQSKDSPLLLDMIEFNGRVDPLASGGPLLDGYGAVVGVVDVVDGDRGFATPIDTARLVADQLIKEGRVVYAWLGVEGDDVDSDLGRRLSIQGGAVVRRVLDGSPAYLSGVHGGDVITNVDEVQVVSNATLQTVIRAHRPGQAVTLKLLRDGKPLSINATLTERPARY
jgi:S1-C subfamily serine protease